MDYVRVGALGEIPEGEARAYDTPAGRVAVAHDEAHLYAFGDECTHQGCSLAEGEFDDRRATIECPVDGSVFDVETGEPIEGPAVDPLPIFQARRSWTVGSRWLPTRPMGRPASRLGRFLDRLAPHPRARRTAMADVRTRFDLQPHDMPTAWFNLIPDMVKAGMQPLPPLSPQTKEPIGPADLAPLFPESLIMQEVSTDQWIDIPGEVIDIYRLWRPSPLFRATAAGAGTRHAGAHLLQVRGRALRRAATSRTPRCRRPSTTGRPASGASRPRPARASGARRWRWRAACSVWSATCTW